jgi:hypothetical protein
MTAATANTTTNTVATVATIARYRGGVGDRNSCHTLICMYCKKFQSQSVPVLAHVVTVQWGACEMRLPSGWTFP